MIGEVENDPWGLAFKIVTKRLVTRRKTPGQDNADRVRYIVRSLFPHVKPFQRQDRSLLDTMGKLLEEMILQRLQGHMVRENGLSENQFGFRKGRSTVDAIQAVVDIATKARRATCKRKGFCALISIDIRNAFNTGRWNICIEAMVRIKVPDYLLRMIDDYLSDRWVIYDCDKWSLKEEMTCGTPQGSRVGPLVWNVMYDDFLRMDLPARTSIIGFADDALVVCATDDVKIRELRINDSLSRAKRWLDSRCLKMAPEKTEALLVTDRRSFKYPRIALGEHEIKWKKSIK